MNSKGIEAAFLQIARQSHLSVAEVRCEIALAIEAGMNSTDGAARTFWAAIPRKGARPTPEETIAYITFLRHQKATEKAPLFGVQ